MKGSGVKNNARIYILFVVAFLLILVSFGLLTSMRKPIGFKEIEVNFIAGGDPAFDINGTALTFGRIPLDSTATRSVIVENSYDFEVEVKLAVWEEIAEFIITNASVFLGPQENARISVSVFIPREAQEGNYNGKINFLTYKAK